MMEEYKVRSGFKCNPWAIKKLSGLQLCAFICPCRADPSAATILPSHFWILIQMYSPSLSLPGVGAPSDTVVHVYSLVFLWGWTSHCSHPVPLVCWLLQIAPHPKMLKGVMDVKAGALEKEPGLTLLVFHNHSPLSVGLWLFKFFD